MSDVTSIDPAAELARAREADLAAATSDGLAALWSAVAAETVGARPTWRERLAELSTPIRIVLALSLSLSFAAVVLAVVGVRKDLGAELVVRYALAMTALAVLAGALFSVALRGEHQRPLGKVAWALVAVAGLVPVGLALMPSLWGSASATPHPGFDACAILGGVTGAFAGVVTWLFQRATTPVVVRATASVAAGGLIAFAMLQLHCPAGDIGHLLLGHASVGVVLIVAVAIGVALRRRVGRR